MRALGRVLGAGALLFLLLMGLLLALLPGRGEQRAYSVFSTRPDGLRALFLMLEELGFSDLPRTQPPGELRGGGDLLVLFDVPPEPPARSLDTGAGADASPPRRIRDLQHYRRFVDEGGKLLLLLRGDEERELGFLGESLGLEELAGMELAPRTEDAPLQVRMSSGATFVLSRSGERRLAGVRDRTGDRPGRSEVLARELDGPPVAVRVGVGSGALIVLLLPPELFSNESLAEQDHALFFVRLLEELRPFERIVFDEYALGGWTPRSPLELAFGPGTIVLSAHLLAFLLLLLWRSAWTGPFARDPVALRAVSALSRAQGLAGLLERAGRRELLARLLRERLLERWCVRAGKRSRAAPEGERSAQALEADLAALFRHGGPLLDRARKCFLETPVRNRSELERLAAELEALDRELFAAPRATAPAPVA